jgi:hypothetical protein
LEIRFGVVLLIGESITFSKGNSPNKLEIANHQVSLSLRNAHHRDNADKEPRRGGGSTYRFRTSFAAPPPHVVPRHRGPEGPPLLLLDPPAPDPPLKPSPNPPPKQPRLQRRSAAKIDPTPPPAEPTTIGAVVAQVAPPVAATVATTMPRPAGGKLSKSAAIRAVPRRQHSR